MPSLHSKFNIVLEHQKKKSGYCHPLSYKSITYVTMGHFIVYCTVKCRAVFCDAAVKEFTICCCTSLTTLTRPRSATSTGTVSWGRLFIVEHLWSKLATSSYDTFIDWSYTASAGTDFWSSHWRIHRNVLHCSFFPFSVYTVIFKATILFEPVFQPAKFVSWIRNRGDAISRSEEYRQNDIRSSCTFSFN